MKQQNYFNLLLTNSAILLGSEIIDLCKKNLAAYALPKEYEFRDSLPKTLYNKINYKELEKEEEDKFNKK